MAGSDMSKGLGGMLSQTAQALGTMGNTYTDSLTRNIENITRPNGDPTDIASQQQLMGWQNKMGRTDEARNTQIGINQMQAKQREAQKQASMQKASNLSSALQRIEADPNMTREQKNMAQARIQEALTGMSGEVGRDLSGTLNQVQRQASQEQRQEDAAQRQREVAEHQNKLRLQAEADKAATTEYYKKAPEEQSAFIEELREAGNVAVADKLESRHRQDTRWAIEQREQAEKTSTADMVPMTAGERTVIDTDLDALKLMNPTVAANYEKKFKAIENDTVLSKKMKRTQIAQHREALSRMVANQTSAAMTATRTAEKDLKKDSELKNPALGLYTSDRPSHPAPAQRAVTEAMAEGTSFIGNVWRGWRNTEASDKDKAADGVKTWIDTVGEHEAARLAAAIVTTYGGVTLQQALVLAAERNMGVGSEGATVGVSGPGDNELGGVNNPIKLGDTN